MFLDFYRLREQPFGVTPDPRYLYFSPCHREALASLFYGIETGRGFLALIAEPGMGKTTLLFQLLDRLKGSGSVRSVFLFQTQCDSRELLRYLLDGLGLDSRGSDFVRMHAQLNEFLLGEAQAGRRVVLFIDEAQNLSDSVLETVRLLSDFEATDKKLLQIVLSGQPDLAHRLLRPGMGQLRQRIAVLTHLFPLPAEEVSHYVNHRLHVAGYRGPGLFTPGALALIAANSEGVPRNINNICFSAMSVGCATGRKQIGRHTLQEAFADLSLDAYVQQIAPAAAPSFAPARPPIRQFSDVLFWGNRLKPWLFRTALLLLVLVSGIIYFGERGSGGEDHSPQVQGDTASAERVPDQGSPPPGIPPSAVQRDIQDGSPAISDSGNSPFTHVVRPNDTLSSLSVRFAGRYDAAVLAEIRELNEDLWDPDYIEVGQRLRLPRPPSKERGAARNRKDVGMRNRSN